MSKRTRTTRDEFDIEQQTIQGWEVVCGEETRSAANQRLAEYQANQPEMPVRIKLRRIKIKQEPT